MLFFHPVGGKLLRINELNNTHLYAVMILSIKTKTHRNEAYFICYENMRECMQLF